MSLTKKHFICDYNKQAEKFLKDTDTEFKAFFLKHGFYFAEDKEPRDIYKITFKRGKKVHKFNFGQSVNDSDGKTKPSAYDVLACLTNYDPVSFKDFCSSYGYDEDSRKAEKTYNNVVEEWDKVSDLWSEEEIKKLQEIN